MKAIQEIVDYLFVHDLLSGADIALLDGQGLLAGTEAERQLLETAERERQAGLDLKDLEAIDWDSLIDPRAAERLEQTETAFDRLPHRRRTGAKTIGHHVTAQRLSVRLLESLAASAENWVGLVDFARRLGPAGDLDGATATVLAATEADVVAAVAGVLMQPRGGFVDLWQAAACRDYRAVLRRGEHGPAVVACQALFEGAGAQDLGRYRQSLAHPGFAALRRLVESQRRILAAIGVLLTHSPAVFERPLFACRWNAGCYWALTLAITASQPDIATAAAIRLDAPRHRVPTAPVFAASVVELARAVTRRPLAGWQPEPRPWAALCCPPAWNIHYGADVETDGEVRH